MKDSRHPGRARPPSWGGSDRFTLTERRLCHAAIAIAVVLAACVIPGFSIFLGESLGKARQLRDTLARTAVDGGTRAGASELAHGQTPQELERAARERLSPREIRRIGERLGFRGFLSNDEARHRMERFVTAVQQRRYDRIPPDVRRLAIERIGIERLRELKERFERMNQSREQLMAVGMRELKKYQ